MNEREKAKLFNIMVISVMAFIAAGFLHLLILSPQKESFAALQASRDLITTEKNTAAKKAAEFKSDKEKFCDELSALKKIFKNNFAVRDIEGIQSGLTQFAKELNILYFNMDFSLKTIYFAETLDIKSGFKTCNAGSFFDFIARARSKYYIAVKTIIFNKLNGPDADISFDFYIPFNNFKIKSLIDENF